MAKPKSPLFSFSARGTLAKALTFRRRGQQVIAETKPIPKDARTSNQLAWRTMYQKCTDLWHTLSGSEKQTWEALARRQHMTGYNYYMSLCLKPNPGVYLPLAGGTMQGNIAMATNRILNLPAPVADEEPLRKIDGAGATGDKIEDADQDTGIYTEQAPDEDKIHIKTKGVECGLFDDAGVLTLAKQSSCKAYRATSAQSIGSGVPVKVQLNAEAWDIQSEFDPITNYKYTAKKAGKYFVVGTVVILTLADGNYCQALIYVNGAATDYAHVPLGAAASGKATASAILSLAVNDFVELYARHNFGANRDVHFGINQTSLSIQKLG